MGRAVLWVSIFFLIAAIPSIAIAAECNDHFDNNNDGYCDFAVVWAYCQDGSMVGDPNCRSADGLETLSCVPSPEVCDGIDNDCNGLTDDGLTDTRNCGLNAGECRYGTESRSCIMGEWDTWGPCIGSTDPVREICGDSKDNDCDGIVDNSCGITTNAINTNNDTLAWAEAILVVIVILVAISLFIKRPKKKGRGKR